MAIENAISTHISNVSTYRSVPNEVPLDERAQTCDAVPGIYEEISDLGSSKVKSDYQYTQNEAYLEVDSGHRQNWDLQ